MKNYDNYFLPVDNMEEAKRYYEEILGLKKKFDFSIDNDTELLWNNTKIEISDLKEGQNVSITSTGEVLESYPAQLTEVTKIIVLEDEL